MAWLDAPPGSKPRASMSLGRAWMLTREILKDHTSNSFASLAGWAYVPTGAEIALWDMMELEGRLKRKGYRPWADPRNDFLREPNLETSSQRRERLERRSRLKKRFHIDD